MHCRIRINWHLDPPWQEQLDGLAIVHELVKLATRNFTQDDHCERDDPVHGQNHPDDAGKPGALKGARRVWRGHSE